MKIFVTVGTTQFDSLIEFLDNNLDQKYDVLLQVANGKYKPKNFKFIEFTKDINTIYEEYDYIITHAGSGTIYKLLELRKPFIVVPNMDRVDHHQADIANFLEENSYALNCTDYNDIIPSLKKLTSIHLNIYEKESFFKAEEICDFIKSSFNS